MRALFVSIALPPLALLSVACGPGEKSVALLFPNENARRAIMRVVIEAHSPESGGASASGRDCRTFLGLAKDGKQPLGTPVRGDYDYPFSSDQELAKIPAGRQIFYALAYASREDSAAPVLEGCADRFDSRGGKDDSFEVPIELDVVIPNSARLVRVAGDRQVGREGEMLAVKLRARVEADAPSGAGQYVIPGVGVSFASEDPAFVLIGGSDPALIDRETNEAGEVEADVMLPSSARSGEVVAFAAALDDPAARDSEEPPFAQTFRLSVTEAPAFPRRDLIRGDGALPVALALGQVTGGGAPDLVVLGCRGSRESCAVGQRSNASLGATSLTVIRSVASAPAIVPIRSTARLGVLPAGLVVADLVPAGGQDDIAVANSRREDCQGRTCAAGRPCACFGLGDGGSCPCEGSEVLVFKFSGGALDLESRLTMTSSNAVGMTAYRTEGQPFFNLAIAAQGRAANNRPCSRVNRCFPHDAPACATAPEECGCPPAERCECLDCTSTTQPGLCVAGDKAIDVLANRWNVSDRPGSCSRFETSGACRDAANEVCQAGVCVPRSLFNLNGCHSPALTCNNSLPMVISTCTCLDGYRENPCMAVDGCGCKVPDRIFVGFADAPTLPFGIAAGSLRGRGDWDLVVPSIGGLELFEARESVTRFAWVGQPIVNAPIHALAVVSLDSAIDASPDVVWLARDPCLIGSNFERSCPQFRASLPEGPVRGCLGAYHTDGRSSVFGLKTPEIGACTRHPLPYTPEALCTGYFNRDGHVDVAIAPSDRGFLAIYSGDGRGGLLDPPIEVELPPGAVGGPVTCGDIDGDTMDDVFVADRNSGDIHVFRTRS